MLFPHLLCYVSCCNKRREDRRKSVRFGHGRAAVFGYETEMATVFASGPWVVVLLTENNLMHRNISGSLVLHSLICLTAAYAMPRTAESDIPEDASREIVVTATRLKTPVDRIGSSITVITERDLQRSRSRNVLDALRQVPGVTVNRSGGPGQTATVFLRGAKPGFTQVMVDGVKANDPAGIGTMYDFGNFNTDNIERIEILRGPQSTLYGGDAMAGVINIITKRGEKEPESFVDIQGGSYDTRKFSAGSAGRINRFDYSFSASHFDTAGFSALRKEDGFGERDAYRNNTFSSRLGFQLADEAAVAVIARYMDSEIDYNALNAFFEQTEEGKIEKEELFLRSELNFSALNGIWEQKIGFGHASLRRDYLEAPGLPDDFFKGNVLQADWQHNFDWHELQTLTLGIDWERNTAETSGSAAEETDTIGVYIQDKIRLADSWFTTLGARVDDNDIFGSETTYRASTTYRIHESGTRIKAAYGTGFKAPSLYELYAADMFTTGNPDLNAQTSRGWDVGVEQEITGEHLSVGATYFETRFADLIEWTPDPADMTAPATYQNIGSATTKGVEAFVSSRFNRHVAARMDYTYLEARGDDGFELRRPENQFAAELQITPTEKTSINIRGRYVDNRMDFGNVKLDSYTLVHLAASRELSPNLTLYGRIDNLFDEDYVEVAGYATPGISGYAGIRASF